MQNTLSLVPWVDPQKPVDAPDEPPVPPPEPSKHICDEDNCRKQFDNAYSLEMHKKVHRQKAKVKPRLVCPYHECNFTASRDEQIFKHIHRAHPGKNTQQRSDKSRNRRSTAAPAPHVRGRIGRRKDSAGGRDRASKANVDLDVTGASPNVKALQPQPPNTPHRVATANRAALPSTPRKLLPPASRKPYPSPIRAWPGFKLFAEVDDVASDRDSLFGSSPTK
ncbi:hypothetical protein LshimejAT787_0904630 [Lyophyllum shimeji]|uniref:C2H2-type domain-containing protein n=1 Tax=Lyophyllum shimeji TaxID=47721 RepID=A0A9P3PSI2_LYOSH|nr:hypothetical protein LshimejAT787_0904630 [Lyophyllum shimeji]